jgi:predicted HicB family RNase H-like nuclease
MKKVTVKKVAFTIKIDIETHKVLKEFCKTNGFFINKFVERAIHNRLVEVKSKNLEDTYK